MGKEISAEQAKAMVEAEKQERGQKCLEALSKLLEKYRCAIVGVPRYAQDGTGGWKLVIDTNILAQD